MRASILKFIRNYHLILLGAVGIVICICVPKVSDLLAVVRSPGFLVESCLV